MKTALIIIAKQGYQDQELDGTLRNLKSQGFTVTMASTQAGPCVGKFGGKQEAAVALKDADVSAYDRIGFIGGPGAAMLADDKEAQRIAKDTVAAGKVLGAICIAPTILAKAGVLKNKDATVWDSKGEQIELLKAMGARYSGQNVTVDGLIVTGNGPHAAEEFGRTFATLGSR